MTGRIPHTMRPAAATLLLLAVWQAAFGQQPAQEPTTLEQAVNTALRQYPSIRVSDAEVRKAAAAIQLARAAYLPKLDALAGVNRASRNNVLGLLLPSQVIAPISGPVLNANNLVSAWGSTVGILATWEPFDFGLRAARVNAAEAGRNRAEADVDRAKLDLSVLTSDSFLTVIAAQQTVIAAEAALTRATELVRITDALVKAELRPGAESSLARAEQAAAQAQVYRARQAVAEATAELAAMMGADPQSLALSDGALLTLPVDAPRQISVDGSPLVRRQDATITESESRLRVLDRSYLPTITIQGTSYARGTGAMPDGTLLGGAAGLAPTIHNWGIGLTVSFPILQFASIRARRQEETAQFDAEHGRRDQILIELKSRRARALAAYEGARQVATTTPAAIEAARAAVEQTGARYRAGLGTALDVADAQRRLSQAEIDDSLARLQVWRARLAVYAAQGDVSPLLAEAGR